MLTVFYVVIAAAIVTMFGGLVYCVRLMRVAPGGVIGRVLKLVNALIVVFCVGYLASPFMPRLPREVSLLFVALIFFFGAVYVVLVLWIIRSLIGRVMSEIKL